MQKIVIPDPLQLTIDDLGWFCGKDARDRLEPSRTGMKRRHCVEDYITVNEIGKRLDMKITCAMIMCEWDPDNRLKDIPGLAPCGEEWDNASYFDTKLAKECVDVINSSPYIELCNHGLQHTYYIKGQPYNNSDFYYMEDGVYKAIPDDEIRMRLDAWYDLLNYHGIKKSVRSFIPPNCNYQWEHLSKILKEYGILYVSTILDSAHPKRENLSFVELEDGVVNIDRNNNLIRWDECESKLDDLPIVSGMFACHWANLCHKDPEKNHTLVDRWVDYFNKCAEEFGVILSKDIAFCATQSVYKQFSKISEKDGVLTIDLTNIPNSIGLMDSFYVSAKEPLTKWTGCDVEIYEKRQNFISYKITPQAKLLKFGEVNL